MQRHGPGSKSTRTAIIYDFDGTLSPGVMHQHSFLPDLGFDDQSQFWKEVKEECKSRDGDEVLTYMQLMITHSKGSLSRDKLRQHGEHLPVFNGVKEWFSRMNEYTSQRGIILEHYVVSSGIKEMIDACPVSKNFTRIFASSFAYDRNGNASWPALAINYTNKTQFIFRINKGIPNSWDNDAINRWIPTADRHIPFERMIFIGDGDTDIPAMKMVRQHGGFAVAVFDSKKWAEKNSQNKIHRLISEDRANYVAPADYSAGSQLDVVVKGILGRIARDTGYRPRADEA